MSRFEKAAITKSEASKPNPLLFIYIHPDIKRAERFDDI
ncbi:hypothetical protein C1G86_0933 [Dehalococcoides mccartyi]|uniref:Uncharacterized protein n=1 Tax=Dehalococcoides mccartyi TaxID=61435 RepID=A0A328EPS7_9CHLR|nr:hypothetical protein C1G87_0906 [Dehalococcoides mccartyi]RAL70557.1 hypothetical protein C1G86_0933 [Dehalococcoides mccartyi]